MTSRITELVGLNFANMRFLGAEKRLLGIPDARLPNPFYNKGNADFVVQQELTLQGLLTATEATLQPAIHVEYRPVQV